MPAGTLHFDGHDYADGLASDPIGLGWMQGSPPPADKLIRFEDDDTLSFPKIRWSLSHTRETVPTAPIWRGPGAPRDLGAVDTAAQAAIDALQFEDMQGGRRLWADTLADTSTETGVTLPFVLNGTVSAVPEPASVSLLLLGAAGLLAARRRAA